MITLSEEDLVKLLDREYNRGKNDGLKCAVKKEFELPTEEDKIWKDPKWMLNTASSKDVDTTSIANTYWTLMADSSM